MRKGVKIRTQKSTATSLPSGCLKLYLKSVSANVESCCGWYPSIRNRLQVGASWKSKDLSTNVPEMDHRHQYPLKCPPSRSMPAHFQEEVGRCERLALDRN